MLGWSCVGNFVFVVNADHKFIGALTKMCTYTVELADKEVIIYKKVTSNKTLRRVGADLLGGCILNKKVLLTEECSSTFQGGPRSGDCNHLL